MPATGVGSLVGREVSKAPKTIYNASSQPKLVNVSFKQQLQQFLMPHTHCAATCGKCWVAREGAYTPYSRLNKYSVRGTGACVRW